MKRILLFVFVFGLVLGTVFINTMNKGYYDKINVLQDHYVNLVSDVVVDKNMVFRNGIIEYYKEFALILLFNCFLFGKVYNGIYLFIKGAGIGIVLSSYVMKYSVKGMVIYILSIFPHYLLYVPAVVLTICAGISMRNIILNNGNSNVVLLRKLSVYFIWILLFSFLVSFFEAYVNVSIYKSFIG